MMTKTYNIEQQRRTLEELSQKTNATDAETRATLESFLVDEYAAVIAGIKPLILSINDNDGVLTQLQNSLSDRTYDPVLIEKLASINKIFALVTNGAAITDKGVDGILLRSFEGKTLKDLASEGKLIPIVSQGVITKTETGELNVVGVGEQERAYLTDTVPDLLREGLFACARSEGVDLNEDLIEACIDPTWSSPSLFLGSMFAYIEEDRGEDAGEKIEAILRSLDNFMKKEVLQSDRAKKLGLHKQFKIHLAPGTEDEELILEDGKRTTDFQLIAVGDKSLALNVALDLIGKKWNKPCLLEDRLKERQETFNDLRQYSPAQKTDLARKFLQKMGFATAVTAVDTIEKSGGSDRPLAESVRALNGLVLFVNSGTDAQKHGTHCRKPFAKFDGNGTMIEPPVPNSDPAAPHFIFQSTLDYIEFMKIVLSKAQERGSQGFQLL